VLNSQSNLTSGSISNKYNILTVSAVLKSIALILKSFLADVDLKDRNVLNHYLENGILSIGLLPYR